MRRSSLTCNPAPPLSGAPSFTRRRKHQRAERVSEKCEKWWCLPSSLSSIDLPLIPSTLSFFAQTQSFSPLEMALVQSGEASPRWGHRASRAARSSLAPFQASSQRELQGGEAHRSRYLGQRAVFDLPPSSSLTCLGVDRISGSHPQGAVAPQPTLRCVPPSPAMSCHHP